MTTSNHRFFSSLPFIFTDNMYLIKGDEAAASNEYLDAIKKAVSHGEGEATEFKFEERDSILYNLGVGAKAKELNYVL